MTLMPSGRGESVESDVGTGIDRETMAVRDSVSVLRSYHNEGADVFAGSLMLQAADASGSVGIVAPDTLAASYDLVFPESPLSAGDMLVVDSVTDNVASLISQTAPIVSTIARFSVSATAGTIDASSWYTVSFNREDEGQSWASNSSGEITLDAGTYLITADITVDESSGNNRTQFEHRAQLNTTGSWGASTTIDGTLRKSYSRNNAAGAQSVSMTFIVDIASATAFRIQSKRDTGVSDGEWIADGNSVTILRVA